MKKIYMCGYCGHSEKQPFEVCANCGKGYTGSKWITGIPKSRRKELKAKLDAALQRIDSLIGENVAAADDLDASESGKSALRAEIDRQVTKTGLLESAIKMLKYENEEPQLDGKLRAPIGKVLTEKDEEIAQLEALVAAKENTLAELRRDFDANQESLYFNTRVEIDRLKSQLDEKGAEIAEHRRHVSEVMKREDALKKELAAKDEVIAIGMKQIDELRESRGNFRNGFNELKATLAAKQAIIDEQRREIADLHDFQFEAETIAPDGSLRVLSRRELLEKNIRLTAELDEALATCTDLAVAGAASDLFRLYDWGEE